MTKQEFFEQLNKRIETGNRRAVKYADDKEKSSRYKIEALLAQRTLDQTKDIADENFWAHTLSGAQMVGIANIVGQLRYGYVGIVDGKTKIINDKIDHLED